MVGRTLTHYRILEKIGAGGMGEVYRALDTKLGREVAVKVLPESMAQHPERIERLHRPFWFDRQREFHEGEAPIFSAPVFHEVTRPSGSSMKIA